MQVTHSKIVVAIAAIAAFAVTQPLHAQTANSLTSRAKRVTTPITADTNVKNAIRHQVDAAKRAVQPESKGGKKSSLAGKQQCIGRVHIDNHVDYPVDIYIDG